MLSRIQAQHYRCFRELDVRWSSYNVLAGANGSGKSTLLDIPQLFADMLRYGIVPAFLETMPSLGVARAQSFNELTHCYQGGDFVFVLEATLPQDIVALLVANTSASVQQTPARWPHTIRYQIHFQIFNQTDLHVDAEYLGFSPEIATQSDVGFIDSQRPLSGWQPVISRNSRATFMFPEAKSTSRRRRFTLRLAPDKLALSNLPLDPSLFPAAVWFIELLKEKIVTYVPNIQALRQACPPGQPKTIRPDAANLPWMVLNLKQERPQMFTAWVEHVQTALPNIAAIDAVRREDDAHAYLKVDYQGSYTVTSSGLSGGTLSILALTILPYLSNPPHLVCLEEPENGIHPRAIETVLQSLSSLYDSQVWLSTHSPIVLAHTDLANLIVMRKDSDGGMEAIAGDQHPRLRDWHGGIDLGSLFAAGVLDVSNEYQDDILHLRELK